MLNQMSKNLATLCMTELYMYFDEKFEVKSSFFGIIPPQKESPDF